MKGKNNRTRRTGGRRRHRNTKRRNNEQECNTRYSFRNFNFGWKTTCRRYIKRNKKHRMRGG